MNLIKNIGYALSSGAAMTRGARLLVVLGAPLALAAVELWHPLFAADAEGDLLRVADRWLLVHLIQLPLFALLALALYFLVDGCAGVAAAVARIGAIVFGALYTAFDAVAGIATGVLAREANGLGPTERATLEAAIDTLFRDRIVGGESSVLAVSASLAWLVAAAAAALALRRAGVHRVAVVLIALSAVLFPLGHTPPNAQLALGCFAAGAALAEFGPRISR